MRQAIQLIDGRRLAFAVFGQSLRHSTTSGTIIYHHGWPSSCREGQAWHNAAAQLGLCMIAVDRPGCGGSTFNPHGSFSSYACDILQLMEQLNLPSAVHMGTSGGGPYACACAALNPPETTAGLSLVASMTHCSGPGSAALMKGMTWSNRIGYNLIAYAPGLTALSLALAAPLMAAAPAAARLLSGIGRAILGGLQLAGPPNSGSSTNGSGASTPAGPAEHKASSGVGSKRKRKKQQHVQQPQQQEQQPRQLQQQQRLQRLQQQAAEGHLSRGFGASSSRALLNAFGSLFMPAADWQVLMSQPGLVLDMLPQMLADSVSQGFRGLFDDMSFTTLPWGFELQQIQAPTLVFQGDLDVNVTMEMAQHFASSIPGAKLHVFPGASHLSLVASHASDVLSAVTAELV